MIVVPMYEYKYSNQSTRTGTGTDGDKRKRPFVRWSELEPRLGLLPLGLGPAGVLRIGCSSERGDLGPLHLAFLL